MFCCKQPELNINWEFRWIYRKVMNEKRPDYWMTHAYVRFLDRDTRTTGILGSTVCLDNEHMSKDEMRLDLLYQALDTICNSSLYTGIEKEKVYKTVLNRYSAVHSVPKNHTKLGVFQKKLIEDLKSYNL